MIRPNELRIGNWVLGDTGIPLIVTATGIKNYSEREPCWNGIPITPEILTEWLGFEYKRTDKSDTYTLFKFGDTLIRVNYVTEGRFKNKKYLVIGNVFTFEDFHLCQYLHQLQNILFALNGKELEIKNP